MILSGRRPTMVLVFATMFGLAAAACSSSPAKSTSTTARATGTVVGSAASTNYGTILVTSTGLTAYMNSGDSPTTSVCSGACLPVWTPLTTSGAPRAGSGLKAGRLGTLARSDGSKQVTYYGHPLYTFAHDTAPGQVNGEGVVSFGGTWYVLDTAGQPVTGAVSSTTSSSPPTTGAAPAATAPPPTTGSTAPPTTGAVTTTTAPPPTTTAPPTTTTAPPPTTTTTYNYYP